MKREYYPTNIWTGVLEGRLVNSFMWDEAIISLQWEEHMELVHWECHNCGQVIHEGEVDDESCCENPKLVIMDAGEVLHDNFEEMNETFLMGDWDKDEEGYFPKRGGEYATIYDSNCNIFQVTKSKWCLRCSRCSPCYPRQGDLSSLPRDTFMGSPVWAYCLPPFLMSESWLIDNGQRVFQYQKNENGNWYWKKVDALDTARGA